MLARALISKAGMSTTTLALLGASLATVCFSAFMRRSRRLAIFQAVTLSIHSISSSLNFANVIPLPIFVYLNAIVYIQMISLLRPKLKSNLWRALISFPGSYYTSCTILWFLFTPLTKIYPNTVYTPLVLCFFGFIQTIGLRKENIDIDLVEPHNMPKLKPLKTGISQDKKNASRKTLRIAQITDPHLGPLMSPERLRNVCDQIVEADPDLVLLTGDNITVESYFAKEGFAKAYEPLKKLKGKTFACLGNHDYEALKTVQDAMASADITLLEDEEATVDTVVGPVQIVGTEFSFKKAKEHINQVITKFPRKDNHLRLFLVHNPAEFVHFPDNEVDLMFSGHTHGGQIGLFSFGIHWTLYNFFTRMPDFGFWGLGKNRLYVHRGTGHYGFPIRLGVPNELSVLTVHL